MNYPPGYYFTKEHEWVSIRNGYAYIGITEYAQKELQGIKNIEIHRLGEQLDADQAFGRIRSIRYLCKLIMPFSGKIEEVNREYCNDPSEFNSVFDPKYWIVKVLVNEPVDTSRLLTYEQYVSYKSQNVLHLIKYLLASNDSGT